MNREQEIKKQVFSKRSNRNHSPFLKERDANNASESFRPNFIKKRSFNAPTVSNPPAGNSRVISEKNPKKNIAIRFNNKKKVISNCDELNAENKGQFDDKNIEITLEKQQGRLNKILESLAKMETSKEKEPERIEEMVIPNKEIEPTSFDHQFPMKEPLNDNTPQKDIPHPHQVVPSNLIRQSLDQKAEIQPNDPSKASNLAAANIRGIFMNEHISKEEYIQTQEKKRKMKEILEEQIKERARKKDEEKRKERELNKIEEDRIRRELSEMEGRGKSENPGSSKKPSTKQNLIEVHNQFKTSEEIERIYNEKLQNPEKTNEINPDRTPLPREKEKERVSTTTTTIPPTPNEKRPETQGILSFEEAEYLKKIIEDNSRLKDDKSKLQEEVDKKEEIINLLMNKWNNNNSSNQNPKNNSTNYEAPQGAKPQSSAKRVVPTPLSQPQIRKNRITENIRPTGLPVLKEDRQLIEEKLRMIDNKIVSARQKSLLLKNEKVYKLKEDYLKRMEDLNGGKRSPYKQYDPGVPTKMSFRQYNSVPPKTTDNSYQRVSSMQEIINEETGNYPEINPDQQTRVLKTSTPKKTNLQMLNQLRDQINDDSQDFADINSFKMIGNYIPANPEPKEKKVITLNLQKNLENLKFDNPNSDFFEKKPLFPNIRSSVELKSRSEFMRLEIPLNPLNKSEDHNSSEPPIKYHFGFQDFRMTPHESKRMVFPFSNDYEAENEFHGMDLDLLHIKSPSLEVKVDDEILVVDHNSARRKINNDEGKMIPSPFNEVFNPYTTNTSINTTSTSKGKFPHEVFRPNLKKKVII